MARTRKWLPCVHHTCVWWACRRIALGRLGHTLRMLGLYCVLFCVVNGVCVCIHNFHHIYMHHTCIIYTPNSIQPTGVRRRLISNVSQPTPMSCKMYLITLPPTSMGMRTSKRRWHVCCLGDLARGSRMVHFVVVMSMYCCWVTPPLANHSFSSLPQKRYMPVGAGP